VGKARGGAGDKAGRAAVLLPGFCASAGFVAGPPPPAAGRLCGPLGPGPGSKWQEEVNPHLFDFENVGEGHRKRDWRWDPRVAQAQRAYYQDMAGADRPVFDAQAVDDVFKV